MLSENVPPTKIIAACPVEKLFTDGKKYTRAHTHMITKYVLWVGENYKTKKTKKKKNKFYSVNPYHDAFIIYTIPRARNEK